MMFLIFSLILFISIFFVLMGYHYGGSVFLAIAGTLFIIMAFTLMFDGVQAKELDLEPTAITEEIILKDYCRIAEYKQFMPIGGEHILTVACLNNNIKTDLKVSSISFDDKAIDPITKEYYEITDKLVSEKELDFKTDSWVVDIGNNQTETYYRIAWVRDRFDSIDAIPTLYFDGLELELKSLAIFEPAILKVGDWTGCVGQGDTVSNNITLCLNFTDSNSYEGQYRIEYPNGTVIQDWDLLGGGQHIFDLDTDCDIAGECERVKPALTFSCSNCTFTDDDTTNNVALDDKAGFQASDSSATDDDSWVGRSYSIDGENLTDAVFNMSYGDQYNGDWLFDISGYHPKIGGFVDWFSGNFVNWHKEDELGNWGGFINMDLPITVTDGNLTVWWRHNVSATGPGQDYDHKIDIIKIFNEVGGPGNWTSKQDTKLLPDGEIVIRFNASHYKNYTESNTSLTLNFTVKNGPADCVVIQPENGTVYSIYQNIVFSVYCDGALYGDWLVFNGTYYNQTISNDSFGTFPPGNHNLSLSWLGVGGPEYNNTSNVYFEVIAPEDIQLNGSVNLPFDPTNGAVTFCVDNETLQTNVSQRYCLSATCFWVNETFQDICSFGCVSSQLGNNDYCREAQNLFIQALGVSFLIVGLAFLIKAFYNLEGDGE